MVLVVGFWMNFFIQLAGSSMQIFTSEVFPTNARASGFGLAQSGGRVGAALSFPAIGLLSTYGLGYVMTGIAAMMAIGDRRRRGNPDRYRDPRAVARRNRAADRLSAVAGSCDHPLNIFSNPAQQAS
jgi:hypothetical protein